MQTAVYTYHGIDIRELSSVIDYLKPYRQQLEKRATKQKWYELQQPQLRYSTAFIHPKIMYPIMAQSSRFTIDNSGSFINDKAFVIPSGDTYLLGVLNSIHVWKWLESICSDLGTGFELRHIYMNKVPIPQASEIERKAISKLVQKCLDAKGVSCEAWEREIDEIVAGLYGFASETPPLDAKTLGFGKGIQHESKVAVLTGKTRKSKQPANTSASIKSDLN
jgi:TaqI-like C-terminal specificity domain